MTDRGLRYVFLAVIVVLVPRAAPAQPAAVGEDPTKLAQAEDLYRKGVDALKDGKTDEAYKDLHDAYAIKPSFDISGNLCQVELMMHKYRDAAEHCAQSVRVSPANGKEDAKKKTAEKLDEAKREIGTLDIKVSVEGAAIAVDGATVGLSPLDGDIYVEAGHHEISASKAGFEATKSAVDIGKGGRKPLTLMLLPTKEGHGGGSDAGGKKAVWPIAVGASLAAVGIGVGIGLIVVSEGKRSDAKDLAKKLTGSCPPTGGSGVCGQITSDANGVNSFRNGSIAAFAIGGAFAVATLIYAVVPAPRASATQTGTNARASVVLAPVIGANLGGFVAAGAF